MENIGEIIKSLREARSLTQQQLAEIMGMKSYTTITKWEKGENSPKGKDIVKLSEFFNVSANYLLGLDKLEGPTIIPSIELVSLPIYGSISCGTGTLDYGVTLENVNVPKEWLNGGRYFALVAKGDSMTGARINEGDVLIIREQNDAENGEIAAVLVDDEIMLKRIYKTDSSFMLLSENPKYEPRVFNPDTDYNVRILGKLKKSITDF